MKLDEVNNSSRGLTGILTETKTTHEGSLNRNTNKINPTPKITI